MSAHARARAGESTALSACCASRKVDGDTPSGLTVAQVSRLLHRLGFLLSVRTDLRQLRWHGRSRLTGPVFAQTDDVFRVFQLLGGTQRELASDKVFIAQLTDPASPVVDVLRHRNQGPRRQASVREMASPKKCVAPARVLMVMPSCVRAFRVESALQRQQLCEHAPSL